MKLNGSWLAQVILVVSLAGGIGARAAEAPAAPDADRINTALEALNRLKGMDLDANPALKTAVLKILDQLRGKPQFIEVLRDFQIKDQEPALLDATLQNANTAAGLEGFHLLLEHGSTNLIQETINGANNVAAGKMIDLAGNSGTSQAMPLLKGIVTDDHRDLTLRKQAVRALAKTEAGAGTLLMLAADSKLAEELKMTAATELSTARWPKLRDEALKILPPPPGKNSEPLPPVAELVKRSGDASNGAKVFRSDTVGCIKCHQVNGEGVDFAPRLSEIGTKLGKDALYEAILEPSAGISFGFEAWSIELKNGDEAFGLVASETPEELAIKAQTGIVTRYKKADIAKRQQSKTSIMPAGLQQTMTTQELVDLVEYLTTLKKAAE